MQVESETGSILGKGAKAWVCPSPCMWHESGVPVYTRCIHMAIDAWTHISIGQGLHLSIEESNLHPHSDSCWLHACVMLACVHPYTPDLFPQYSCSLYLHENMERTSVVLDVTAHSHFSPLESLICRVDWSVGPFPWLRAHQLLRPHPQP